MSSEGIKVVFGAASIANREPWISADYNEKAFQILLKHGANTLDSAQLYGESEKGIGELHAGDRFIIDTKWKGGWQPGWATKENIVTSAKESIEKLKVKQVSRLCCHVCFTSSG